jgi:hypothetical protein
MRVVLAPSVEPVAKSLGKRLMPDRSPLCGRQQSQRWFRNASLKLHHSKARIAALMPAPQNQ